MMSPKVVWILCCLTATSSSLFAQESAQPPSESDSPRNLLTIETAKIAETSAQGDQASKLASLTDGDSVTPVLMSIRPAAPLEIVFEFGEQTVSPETLVLELGDSNALDPPTVEILASTLSPHTGFQSLRVARPEKSTGRHEFSFVQSGAKWVQIRITPVADANTVAIAEIEVLGHIGAPATRYEFKESPAKALDVLSQLKELVKVQVSPDEQSLFADARDGRLDEWTFAEAALIASGVTDREKRDSYLKQIDQLEAGAREAVKGTTSAYATGEKLLVYLHSKPLSNGYESDQTDLSILLDTASYNCVSSATIYNVLGRRLGLDVRSIEVPDHAFSIVYDGSQHADVEATTPQGFNPSRDPRILEEFLEQTGFRHIPDRHPEQRREIGDTGLVSIIYYNHGVMHSEKKEFDKALVRYFCALSLDPEFDSAVKNALAALANWGVALSDGDKFDEALAVVNAGLKLAPEDATLLNNRKAIWHGHVEAAMDAGDNDRAIALLGTAHQQVPDGNFKAMQSWVFLRPAEEAITESRWEDALKLAAAGIPKVDPDARKELEEWRDGLFLRWSNHHLNQQQFAEAVAALEKGLAINPDDQWMTNNLGYITQEWAVYATKEEGPQAAEAVLNGMMDVHGAREPVREAAGSWVIGRVNQLREDLQYEEALEALSRGESFLPSDDDRLTLQRSIYDAWSNEYAGQGKWQEALAVYEKVLEQLPDDAHLTNNLKATWDRWAETHMRDRRWSEVAAVYAKAMEKLPGGGFDRNLAFMTEQWLQDVFGKDGVEGSAKVAASLLEQFDSDAGVRSAAQSHFSWAASTLAGQQEFEEALKVIDRGEKLFEDKQALLNGAHIVYDHWASSYQSQQKWQEAADVYTNGLKRYPGDSHLTNNATVLWDSWARTYFATNEWAEAIKVYEKALEVFPSSSLLGTNLKYCQQQAGQ